MYERRGDLAHRDKDKIPEMKARMGEGQEFGFGLFVIVEEKVEVDRSRFLERLVLAAEQVLDPEHPGHHLRRRDALALELGDHVEEVGIALDLDRLGLVDSR